MLLNSVSIEGRLTKDPELRHIDSGKAVITFTIACPSTIKGEEADFISIVVWGKQAENVATYCKKGQLVSVSGRLKSRSYVGQDGTKRYVTEVVANSYRGVNFIGSKYSKQNYNNGGQQNYNNGGQQNYNNGGQQNYNNGGQQNYYNDQPFNSQPSDNGGKDYNMNTSNLNNELYSMPGTSSGMPW